MIIRWKTKKPLVVMSYLRAQCLVHFFSPSIFRGLIVSKRLLDTHTHPQESGGSPASRSRRQIPRATAVGTLHLTGPGRFFCSSTVPLTAHCGQINTALPGPDMCHSMLQGCQPVFICVYSIPRHLGSGEFKPCIGIYFSRRKLFLNET